MGCTSSSLKGDFDQSEGLARPSKVSDGTLPSRQDPNDAQERVQSTVSDKATRQKSTSRFESSKKKPPPSNEELMRATGMTSEELQAWG